MASAYNAQILIGAHQLGHGGIIPEYQLFLTDGKENLMLMRELQGPGEWIWHPSKDSMLDDIFLMISTIVFGENKVDHPEKLSLMDRYTEKERFDFYEKVKNNSNHWNKKIFINLFDSSSIIDQLEQVREYNCDVEITKTRYLRESDSQSGKINEKGSLYQ
jgi:hypothetical protein